MANTRDTLGEQATLDGLVNHTLTSLEEDGVTSLGNYALYRQSQLTSVKFPNLQSTGQYAFQYCTGLQHITADQFPNLVTISSNAFANCSELIDASFPKVNNIQSSAFASCSKLAHLILENSSMATLNGNLSGTKIASGDGAVYVPQNLLATYKANASWKQYLVVPTTSYPLSSFESTSETWAQIEANGGENLSLGDRKAVSINGTDYIAVLIGKKKDTLVSGGLANTTWMLLKIYSMHDMNSSQITVDGVTDWTVGGYEHSDMRTYLTDTILPTIDIKDLIKEVVKVSDTYENGAIVKNGQTTHEKLWIPSAYEMFGGTSYETEGCTYSDFFTDNNSRIKYWNGSAFNWWLRSVYSTNNFRYVYSNGNAYVSSAGNSNGVAPCFCI